MPSSSRNGGATALIALDAVLGALLGPSNLSIVSHLVRSERTREWLMSVSPWARLLYDTTFWYVFAAPCALATAIAAPLLIRYLEQLGRRSPGKYLRVSAVAGVVFGLWVTSFAMFISILWLTFESGGASVPRTVDSVLIAVVSALAFAPLIAVLCLPAILVSGSLFGMVNGVLIRRGTALGS
jgi:hypothetical protein